MVDESTAGDSHPGGSTHAEMGFAIGTGPGARLGHSHIASARHHRRAWQQPGDSCCLRRHLADDVGTRIGRRELLRGYAKSRARHLRPGLLVWVKQEVYRGPVPIGGDPSRELVDDVLLAVEQPSRPLPEFGTLFSQPQNLGNDVLGRGNVACVLKEQRGHPATVPLQHPVGLLDRTHV